MMFYPIYFTSFLIWLGVFPYLSCASESSLLGGPSSDTQVNTYIENSTYYEGWQRVSTLNFPLSDPNKTIIDMDGYHRQLGAIPHYVTDDQPPVSLLRLMEDSDKKNPDKAKNLALIRFSLLTKIENAYKHKTTDCFTNCLFFSNDAPRNQSIFSLTYQLPPSDVLQNPEEKKKKKKAKKTDEKDVNKYYTITTSGDQSLFPSYPNTLQSILEDLKNRFLKSDFKNSALSEEAYFGERNAEGFKIKRADLTTPNRIMTIFEILKNNQPKDQPAVPENTLLEQSIKIYSTAADEIIKRHNHSEPKLLFFLKEAFYSIPAYWNFEIDTVLELAAKKVEEFIAFNYDYEYFWSNQRAETLQSFQNAILNSNKSLKEELSKEFANFSDTQQLTTKYDRLSQEATTQTKKLRVILESFDKLQQQNPLKLDLLDSLGTKQEVFSALYTLERMLTKTPYRDRTLLYSDTEIVRKLQSLLQYQSPKQQPLKDFLTDFSRALQSLGPRNIEMTSLLSQLLKEDTKLDTLINTLKNKELSEDKLTKSLIPFLNPTCLTPEDPLSQLYKEKKDYLKFLQLYEKQEMTIQGLSNPHISQITELYLHLYSYHEICESCAPSIARECERKDGFIQRLKSFAWSYNAANFPSITNEELKKVEVRLFASCSHIRPLQQARWDSPVFQQDPNKRAHFIQAYFPIKKQKAEDKEEKQESK